MLHGVRDGVELGLPGPIAAAIELAHIGAQILRCGVRFHRAIACLKNFTHIV
jgi:hypothetical protein